MREKVDGFRVRTFIVIQMKISIKCMTKSCRERETIIDEKDKERRFIALEFILPFDLLNIDLVGIFVLVQ